MGTDRGLRGIVPCIYLTRVIRSLLPAFVNHSLALELGLLEIQQQSHSQANDVEVSASFASFAV
jgi:hypothetical protein